MLSRIMGCVHELCLKIAVLIYFLGFKISQLDFVSMLFAVKKGNWQNGGLLIH